MNFPNYQIMSSLYYDFTGNWDIIMRRMLENYSDKINRRIKKYKI